MMAVFAVEPPLGTRILLDDQVYDLVAAEPYTRKTDGQPSRLLVWDTTCPAAGCGESFRAMSGLTVTSLARRCETHREVARPVKGKRGRKVRVRVELP